MLDGLFAAVPGRVRTEPELLDQLRSDRSGMRSSAAPLALVEAETVADVQATCRYANEHGIPVVTRGAGTGLSGGAVAGHGEIVLSTAKMTRIHEISRDDLLCVVEPGIINGDLNRELAKHGLWWSPDPASKDLSTVGAILP